MTWTPTRTAVKWESQYEKCAKCGYNKIDTIVYPVYQRHESLCDYYIYRDKIAPIKYQKLIHKAEPELPLLLEVLNIPHVMFKFGGITGSYIELFVREDVVAAVELYHRRPEYAGLSLSEYLRRMVGP